MELSLKKYLTAALKWLIPFLLLEFLIGILRLAGIAETESFALISAVNVLFLLLPGMCFLAMFFVFKKKCKSFIPAEGVIANWNSGFYRYTGSVIIKIDEKEFSNYIINNDVVIDATGATFENVGFSLTVANVTLNGGTFITTTSTNVNHVIDVSARDDKIKEILEISLKNDNIISVNLD